MKTVIQVTCFLQLLAVSLAGVGTNVPNEKCQFGPDIDSIQNGCFKGAKSKFMRSPKVKAAAKKCMSTVLPHTCDDVPDYPSNLEEYKMNSKMKSECGMTFKYYEAFSRCMEENVGTFNNDTQQVVISKIVQLLDIFLQCDEERKEAIKKSVQECFDENENLKDWDHIYSYDACILRKLKYICPDINAMLEDWKKMNES